MDKIRIVKTFGALKYELHKKNHFHINNLKKLNQNYHRQQLKMLYTNYNIKLNPIGCKNVHK